MSLPNVFSGRWDELYLFAQCWNQARRGQPQIILIEGEPGLGKTALLGAFAAAHERQHERHLRVFTLQPPTAGSYDPVREATLAITAKRLYERVGGRRGAKGLLFEWISAIPGWGNFAAAVTASVDAVRRRRVRAAAGGGELEEDVEALLLSAQRSLTLLFDDLHLADAAAIARLEGLIRAAGKGTRLLLVGVYRPAARGSVDPPIRKLIQALPAGKVHHRKLRALTAKEVNLWLNKQFPMAVKSPDFLEWLLDSTGGHPATLETTLAHLLDRSVIRFVGGHWEIEADRERHEVAQTSEAVVDLSGIRPEVADVVRSASVIGEEFDGSSLARLLDQDELYVEDQLALGVHHDLLVVVGETTLSDGEIATLYRFATPYLRAALYNGLPSERRSHLEQQRSATVFSS